MDCKECIFALTGIPVELMSFEPSDPPEYTQIGCGCDRIDIFEERGEAVKTVGESHYQLTKFCNMYRTGEWAVEKLDGNEDEELYLLLEARQEVTPLFGVAVLDHPSKDMDDLNRTCESLRAMDYQSNKIKVVLSTFQARGISAVSNLVNQMQLGIRNTSAIFHILNVGHFKETEVFKKLILASYFVYIDSGAVLPPDIFMNVDISLNEKLERIAMFEGDGFTIISKNVVKSLYLEYNDYSKMVNHVRHISQERDVYEKI